MDKEPCKDNSAIYREIDKILKKHPYIELALLFGSLAKGGFRRDSDVDLAVSAGRVLEISEKMQLIAELGEATGRPVDLIDLYVVGEPLLGQIIAGGRRLLGSDTLYAQLLSKHLFEQADFMPYRRRILEERRKAWIGV